MSNPPIPSSSGDTAQMWHGPKDDAESLGGWRTKWVSPDALVALYLGSTDNASQLALSGLLLYDHLTEYFNAHLKGLRDASDSLQGEALLRYYTKEWDRYTTGANFINRLFTYLNRHWVQRERDEGRKGVYPVYTVRWRSYSGSKTFSLYIHNKNQGLANAVLRLIEDQRNGQIIDIDLVKKVVDSFVSLGVDDFDPDKPSFDLYEEHFEIPLINAIEKYYRHESELLLANKSIREYLKKLEEWLKEEEDRVERCMNNVTRKALVGMFASLIREHEDAIWKDFQDLLDFENYEDLRWMYGLLARIHEDLEPLRKKFEQHVKNAGLAAVAKLIQKAREGGAPAEVEPKAYVDALLEVHAKSLEIVSQSFKGEAGFAASLDRACKDFVNKNTATGTSATKSPELLAKHTDALLRKNNKVGEGKDLEDALNKVMTLFKYIEDKDVFQTFYTIRLSKRLIHGVSASDEAEASMIAKLKDACGFEYTKTLQRMFMDMSLSKDLTNSFKEKMAPTHDESDFDVDFSVMVLGTNFWPLTAPRDEFVIPKDILATDERFTRFFGHTHQGRKLKWLWNYSKNELRTNYLKEKYILTCSSYQMAVLVQFNDYDTLFLDELLKATGIGRENLVQVLGILVKARILINKEQDKYDLNLNYKSKKFSYIMTTRSSKIRVNLNLPTKADVKAESANVLKTVVEDRKYAIQATIVRVMKARKQLKNQQLIQEVTAQISQRFTPRVPDMKKVEGQPDLFNYLA
ncbi:hypothetical protein FRC00_000382 [Tulasnella sp. 408]|nr:hypothetical protein FRC00_000382 [Tulasnella sp. 408]